MQKPYFLDNTLPSRVKSYMEDNEDVDIEQMTIFLMKNYKEFKTKNKKLFMKSVKKAHDWIAYCKGNEVGVSAEGSVTEIVIDDEDYSKKKSPEFTKENGSISEDIKEVYRDQALQILTKKNISKYSKNGEQTKKRKEEGTIARKIKKIKLMEQEEVTVTLKDVVGISSLKYVFQDLLSNLYCPESKEPLSKSALVTGPSGSGKTMFAMALAGQAKVPLFKLPATELIGSISGESEENIKDMFNQIVSSAPAVLLIEGLDVIVPREGSVPNRGMERRICSQLISCLKWIHTQHKDDRILVLAESSFPEKLDWNLRSTFDVEVFIPVPSKEAREEILRVINRDMNFSIDFKELALLTPGYVAGDLWKLINKARSIAWNRKKDELLKGSQDPSEECDRIIQYLQKAEKTKTYSYVTMNDCIKACDIIVPILKREGFPTVPETTWDDIGGLEVIKKELCSKVLDPIEFADLHQDYGAGRPNGLLLWGPPGCGKTLLAKAVANQAGINLLPVSGPELLNMYQGESERAIRDVFTRAFNVAPCVIFFDEFDSICPQRSKGVESGSKTTIVNTLLMEMNGLKARQDVYVMAATNRPDILDPAITRPGRFDTMIYVGLPDLAARVSILNARTKNGTLPHLAPDVDLTKVAALCENFSGADCDQLVYLACKEAIEEDIQAMTGRTPDQAGNPSSIRKNVKLNLDLKRDRIVSSKHISAALIKVKPSVSKEERLRYERLHKRMQGELLDMTPCIDQNDEIN